MSSETCSVEIFATVTGCIDVRGMNVKEYVFNKYKVSNLVISDIIHYNSTNHTKTNIIITYKGYYDEEVPYCYYDFVKTRKKEILEELTNKFFKMELIVDDIDVTIF
ncbi:MAG: hypothetical protein ACRDD8_14740 [Bacteroidales bacterium]